MSFKKILVPTDFSIHAGLALHHALDLARVFEASVTLLHTYEWPIPVTMEAGAYLSGDMIQAMEREAQSSLDEATAQAHRHWKGAAGAIACELAVGPAALRITEKAKQGHYDLVVMGTHGRTGLKRLLIGSVAERVVRSASCPVLTVRATLDSLVHDEEPSAETAHLAPPHATAARSLSK